MIIKEKILGKGAEAIIILKDNIVIKERIPKGYRHEKIDQRIRKSRTKKEAKMLEKAAKIINVPNIIKQNMFSLELEYIQGDRLSEHLNLYDKNIQKEVMQSLGAQLAKLHMEDMIHGDLTTSNVILRDKKVYILDFGLGFISKRIEDKAVDLHLIKKALETKHWQKCVELFKYFLKGYSENKYFDNILEQLKKVESRGRYKG
jgi:TP53 regulating kinase and related kinases